MARSRTNLAEGMQFGRQRLPEEAIPCVGSKPHDTGKPSFQITKFNGSHQRGELPTKRVQDSPILRARVERRDQEDRGASKRRGYRLCEGRRSTCRFGCVHRIDPHRVSSLSAKISPSENAMRDSRVKPRCASLPSAAKALVAIPRWALWLR